jgi:hypothetical protein
MNHPAHEDWMSFLYGEDSPERHAQLETHSRTCPECAARVNAWRRSANALDEWTLPEARTGQASARPGWKWAAAAALVLGLGVALGRFALPGGSDAEALRASLMREFDQKVASARTDLLAEFRKQQAEATSKLLATALDSASGEAQRLLAEYAKDQETQRLGDKQALVTALRQLDAKYTASFALLRKELETVAVNTEDSFVETEQRLGQLASITQPSNLQPR